MANIRLVKGRIKSAENISQITKAMELVAASRMRKAQAAAVSGKLYAQKIYDMVMTLSSRVSLSKHPLLGKPKPLTGRKLTVVISSNRGLCGGLNTNLFRFFLQHHPTVNGYDFVTLGKKGVSFVIQAGGSIKADFSDTTPFTSIVPAVTEMISNEYIAGSYDAVSWYTMNLSPFCARNPKPKPFCRSRSN